MPDHSITSPAEIMERLKALPEHLQPHNRRFYVEAVSEETKAPLIEYFLAEAEAEAEVQVWAKRQGAGGFYPPRDGGHPIAFSFKNGSEPAQGGAWGQAGRGYVARSGYVAMYLTKRPAGKKLKAEVEALPAFPRRRAAMEHLGAVTDLRTKNGSGGVGYSDGKMHFSVPFEVNGRYFINVVNHNYDIARAVDHVVEYAGTENEQYGPSLDYRDDPIAWRPGDGWAVLSKTEIDFIIAEENLRRAKARAQSSEATHA